MAGTLLTSGGYLGVGCLDSVSYANKGKAPVDVYVRTTWKSGGTGSVHGA